MSQVLSPQQRGGQAAARLPAPLQCPRCGKVYPFAHPWMAHLGHLGLHGLADRYFGGDMQAAQTHLRQNGLAKQDPAPWNRAWRPYVPVQEARDA